MMDILRRLLRKSPAWLPWDWDKELHKAEAIRSCWNGEASSDQQRLAINTIVEEICQTYGMSYSPDNPYDTAFAEGMRHVGNQIIKVTRLNIGRIERAKNEHASKPDSKPRPR